MDFFQCLDSLLKHLLFFKWYGSRFDVLRQVDLQRSQPVLGGPDLWLDEIVVASAYQLSQIFDHFVIVASFTRNPYFADGSPCRQLARAGAAPVALGPNTVQTIPTLV